MPAARAVVKIKTTVGHAENPAPQFVLQKRLTFSGLGCKGDVGIGIKKLYQFRGISGVVMINSSECAEK